MSIKISPELDLYTQILDAALPEPERQYRFHPVRRWKLDFAWPDLRLAVEVEGQNSKVRGKWVWGAGRHNRPEGFEKDCIKYNSAALAGWKVLRFTAKMAHDGRALATLREALNG